MSKVEELIIGVGNNIDYGVKVTDKTLKECVVAMSRMQKALLDLRAQSVEGSINRTIINNALGIEDPNTYPNGEWTRDCIHDGQ